MTILEAAIKIVFLIGTEMTTKLLKMRTLEDESEEDLTAGGGLDLLSGGPADNNASSAGGSQESNQQADDGRPAWMKQLAETASQWLSLVPKVSFHSKIALSFTFCVHRYWIYAILRTLIMIFQDFLFDLDRCDFRLNLTPTTHHHSPIVLIPTLTPSTRPICALNTPVLSDPPPPH